MSRALLPSVLALLLALAWAAPASAGKAYKCVIDGKTTYQDHPCGPQQTEPPPPAAVVAPVAPVAPPRVQRSPSQIFDEIQMVERHARELSEGYKRDAELSRLRLAKDTAAARAADAEQLKTRWLPRIRAEQQKAERLRTELRAQCPKGAGTSAGRFECLR